MPKAVTQLSNTKVLNSKPKDKDYVLVDGEGLRLLVKTNGSKIWEFIYSSPILKEERKTLIKDINNKNILDKDGNKTYRISEAPKRRKKALGKYPTLSLAEARKQRSINLMILENNNDPIEYYKEKEQKEKAQNTGLFINVMNEWFIRQKSKLAKVTYDRKYQVFVSSVLPYFKDKHIKDITKLELLHLLEEKEKTAKETASRLFNYLSNLWAYAVLKDYCEYNYLSNINKNDVLTHKRVVNNYAKITDEETFKELVNKIYTCNSTPSIKNALKFVLHIPLRAYNLCYLKWAYIDLDKKLLTIPRDLMKVKNHNLPPFQLPLTDEVINILQEQKEYSTIYAELKEFVFIGNDNINPINRESPNAALTRLGFTAERKQSLHSFRGSFRTIVEEKQEEHNISEKIMESILDHHKDTKVEQAYKNKVSYLEQQKPLMNFWSDYIMSLKDNKK